MMALGRGGGPVIVLGPNQGQSIGECLLSEHKMVRELVWQFPKGRMPLWTITEGTWKTSGGLLERLSVLRDSELETEQGAVRVGVRRNKGDQALSRMSATGSRLPASSRAPGQLSWLTQGRHVEVLSLTWTPIPPHPPLALAQPKSQSPDSILRSVPSPALDLPSSRKLPSQP